MAALHRRERKVSMRAAPRPPVEAHAGDAETGPAAGAAVTPHAAALHAVAELYHGWLTGLLLMVVSRRGGVAAAELVFRIFRRQQLEKFLPGLDKLGLRGLPDAVACAQYHYLSNHVGGVAVEYVPESDRKSWIRYPPPRWIFDGTAICGIPSEVSRAMLRGWHANNGVLLGNPRLGFVCTKQTVDGQPGLEGYYLEHDRVLEPDRRLRFSPGEDAPDFDPAEAPALESATWPEERLRKAYRNYAMDYLSTAIPVTIELFGPAEGAHLTGLAARLIGMQYHDRTLAEVAMPDPTTASGAPSQDFITSLALLLAGQGDPVEILRRDDGGSTGVVRQRGFRLMRGVPHPAPAMFEAWAELWRGLVAAHDRRLRVEVVPHPEGGATVTVTGGRSQR
jgi:hypothetical protein